MAECSSVYPSIYIQYLTKYRHTRKQVLHIHKFCICDGDYPVLIDSKRHHKRGFSSPYYWFWRGPRMSTPNREPDLDLMQSLLECKTSRNYTSSGAYIRTEGEWVVQVLLDPCFCFLFFYVNARTLHQLHSRLWFDGISNGPFLFRKCH